MILRPFSLQMLLQFFPFSLIYLLPTSILPLIYIPNGYRIFQPYSFFGCIFLSSNANWRRLNHLCERRARIQNRRVLPRARLLLRLLEENPWECKDVLTLRRWFWPHHLLEKAHGFDDFRICEQKRVRNVRGGPDLSSMETDVGIFLFEWGVILRIPLFSCSPVCM